MPLCRCSSDLSRRFLLLLSVLLWVTAAQLALVNRHRRDEIEAGGATLAKRVNVIAKDRNQPIVETTRATNSKGSGTKRKPPRTDRHSKGGKERRERKPDAVPASNAKHAGATTTQQQRQSQQANDSPSAVPPPPSPSLSGDSSHKVDLAYLTIISNDDFVDGALVLGRSLRSASRFLQDRKADLAIIVTRDRLNPANTARLRSWGTYDNVVEVDSLAPRAPNAFWKDTFDKCYMFNLTRYRRIVFMDADMVTVRSPDALFDLGHDDPMWVSAIGWHDHGGGSGKDTYFQTGMMVIQPNSGVFASIMKEFEDGVPPRGSKYNHGMNGRDGVLLRNVFKGNFKELDNKYSRNLDPRRPIPNSVVSLHLRGKHKPWFDKSKPNADPELGKKDFGITYALWWSIYESMHVAATNEQSAALVNNAHADSPDGFGGTLAAPSVGPLTHVWMMRYTKKEYVQLLSSEDQRQRNYTDPGTKYVVGAVGASCDATCASESLHCTERALRSSVIQDCAFLKTRLGCAHCEMGVYWKAHPGNDYPSLETNLKVKWRDTCRFNFLHDERSMPRCNAFNTTTRRLCPCTPVAAS